MLVVYLCSALLLLTSTSATRFTNCEDAQDKVTKVEIEGCDDLQGSCAVVDPLSYSYSITFTPTQNYDKVYLVLPDNQDNIYKDDQNPDLCQGSLTCPLTAGQDVTFSSSFDVFTAGSQQLSEDFSFTDGENVIACASVIFDFYRLM